MEKRIRIKCIVSFICSIIGIGILVVSLYLKEISQMQLGYLQGFATSFSVVSFILFIRNLISMTNAKSLKNREIQLTDERNIQIQTKSMAVTFRICILLHSVGSILLVFINNELGIYLGLLVGIELIVYVISNIIISKKI